MTTDAALQESEDFLEFLNASPSAFHAVHAAKIRLEKEGFTKIRERDPWAPSLQPGGKYYLTRNESTIVAFAIGAAWKPGNPITIVGAHSDSPCLKLKPIARRSADGFTQVGVESYGSGLLRTWFDRDLGVAGRVIVKQGPKGIMGHRLVRLARPIMRIPNLAVHFGGSVPFDFNAEDHLHPLAGLVSAELNRTGQTAEELKAEQRSGGVASAPSKAPAQRHHPYLVSLVSQEANCAPHEILDFELVLYDTQPACLGGLNNEFVSGARLDNLAMMYCAVEGLLRSLNSSEAVREDGTIRMFAAFDHEEIGSRSAHGADSNMLPSIIRRLSCLRSFDEQQANDREPQDLSTVYEQSLAKSFFISADMAHGFHPNYASKSEAECRAEMNGGPVIKVDANVQLVADAPAIAIVQECARRAKPTSYQSHNAEWDEGVPLQWFVSRNDIRCGSTYGPMVGSLLGMKTIDVGNAQLAMHSIRETAGYHDIGYAVNLFESFYEHYEELEQKMMID